MDGFRVVVEEDKSSISDTCCALHSLADSKPGRRDPDGLLRMKIIQAECGHVISTTPGSVLNPGSATKKAAGVADGQGSLSDPDAAEVPSTIHTRED